MQGREALLVISIGYVAGVLWQLGYRRDLADRLMYFVVFVAIGALFLGLVPTGLLLANSGPGHVGAGILVGLVVAEQWIRFRTPRVEPVSERLAQPSHN